MHCDFASVLRATPACLPLQGSGVAGQDGQVGGTPKIALCIGGRSQPLCSVNPSAQSTTLTATECRCVHLDLPVSEYNER